MTGPTGSARDRSKADGPAEAGGPASGGPARKVAEAGHRGDADTAREHLTHPDPAVRAVALGALARLGLLQAAHLETAVADPSPGVRRRAAELAATRPAPSLLPLLDGDPAVAEMAAWALGERGASQDGRAEVVRALSSMAAGHSDALCREAAVAALGAIGDPAGLPAILAATSDRPAVRRRAVIALAPFDGPEVEAALQRALTDHDWQVRQAAEDQLGP